VVRAVGAALVRAGAAETLDVQRHQPVGDATRPLGKDPRVRRLRKKRAQGRRL